MLLVCANPSRGGILRGLAQAREDFSQVNQGVNAKLGKGGRVVIPAEYRRELGLESGDSVAIQLVDNEIRIVSRGEAVKRAQALVRKRIPKGRSLVAELRDDRRREAADE
jgi:AbrB family looped-hinge helix DNA binding protein